MKKFLSSKVKNTPPYGEINVNFNEKTDEDKPFILINKEENIKITNKGLNSFKLIYQISFIN